MNENDRIPTVIHTTDRKYGCHKQALPAADIIVNNLVKHPASEVLIVAGRSTELHYHNQSQLVAGVWGRRGWGTRGGIYPAGLSAEPILLFAVV